MKSSQIQQSILIYGECVPEIEHNINMLHDALRFARTQASAGGV